jgi:hypothetical protein
MNRVTKLFLIVIFSWVFQETLGQTNPAPDSLKSSAKDTVKISAAKSQVDYIAKRFNPRKALLFSAVLPGAGQVYNKKYWKVPLVYGAIFLIGVVPFNFYNQKYTIYKNQLFAVINYPDPVKGLVVSNFNLLADSPKQLAERNFTKQQLEDLTNSNRRQRDYFVIIAGFMYILQMVDAHVDAHLKEFKVNPNLNIAFEPRVEQNYFTGNTTGAALVFKFR